MKNFSAIVAGLLLAACSAQNSHNVADVKASASDALIAYTEAINTGDLQRAASFYDDDPDFHWIERGGVQYDNAEAASASLQGFAIPGATAAMTLDQIHVADLSATAALVSTHFDFSMTFENGEGNFAFDGWMSVAMVKRDDGWRIAGGQVGPGTPQQ